MELQKKLLKKANNKEAYDEIADQIFNLREQRVLFRFVAFLHTAESHL